LNVQTAVIGFDVGGTNLRSARADAAGVLSGRRERPTPTGSPEALIDALTDEARAQMADSPEPVGAIGLAMKGFCNVRTGVVHGCKGLGWDVDAPLVGPLAEAAGVPVRLVNDVNAAAWSEARARGCRDLVSVFVGTGVGTGLVSSGVLLEGHRGCAAEGGHILFRENGVAYAAGEAGCYEAYLGGAALAQRARDARVAEDTVGLVAAWTAGDDRAALIMEDACAAMASLVRLLVGMLDPEVVVVGGGVARACPALLSAAQAALDPHPMLARSGAVEVCSGDLDADAGLVGAALLAADLIGAA
jgi:glucokinase